MTEADELMIKAYKLGQQRGELMQSIQPALQQIQQIEKEMLETEGKVKELMRPDIFRD